MKIILVDGTELSPILVMGERRYVQRESRDTLTFIFPESAGLEVLDALFTAENCESMKQVGSDGTEYIHKGYTIRAELAKKPVQISEPTETADAVYENRIFVAMSQRTDLENMAASNYAAINALANGEG